jgi:aminopeptidase N
MPEINSTMFVKLFQDTLAKGDTVSEKDVQALDLARSRIRDTQERAAATGLFNMVRYDHELDSFEVAPARKALSFLLGVSTGPLPAELEKALAGAVPQANVGVKSYDLSFDFSKDAPTFPAHALITLDKKAPKETVLEANTSRLAISAVLADGKPARFELKDNRLHVFAPGARTLDVTYTVKPTDASDTAYGLIRDRDSGRMWTLTWPYNTGALFPSNSAPSDAVTSRVTVKVEGGTQVVAGGDLKDGAFVEKTAEPAYGIAFYLGKDFANASAGKSAGGVAVDGYGLATGIGRGLQQAYVDTAKKALDFYSGWLGKYDYGGALKLVEIEGGLGGMEHTGAVAIMSSSAKDPAYGK